MIKKTLKILSTDNIHKLHTTIILPEGAPKGIFHIVHGMTEYMGRYEPFMEFLAQNGFIAVGFDNLGHGFTAKKDELGFIAKRRGHDYLVRDVEKVAREIKKEYGFIPYILMGHSMGSFIVRNAAARYSFFDKLIIMGTSGPNPIAGIGLIMIKIIKFIFGEKHISPFIEAVAFGSYNKNFEHEQDPRSWITGDEKIREKYSKDEFCNFHFTSSALHDLVKLNSLANKKETFKKTAKRPILLVSGSLDPVGDNQKGVEKCYELFTRHGADIKKIIYQGYRHEILNDDCRQTVYKDILSFIIN